MRDSGRRFSFCIEGRREPRLENGEPVRVGVLPGEGIGPEVIGAATEVLEVALAASGHKLALTHAPPGDEPELTEATVEFCRKTVLDGGALLAGPHGGRWVYDLRRELDLFCKISPLQPSPELGDVGAPVAPRSLEGVDVLVVREQTEGIYQGSWSHAACDGQGEVAQHSFSYSERAVGRIADVAAAIAACRRGELTVVVKDGGIPTVSRLWREGAQDAARRHGVRCRVLDADYAAYLLMRDPRSLDVVVAPNMVGDVLSDLGGALLGSRGLTYGGNFDAGSAAVYQTNHGAAHDLAGSNRANPVGQILSAAMMLRESFGLLDESVRIERAIAAAWRDGARTEDIAEPGCRVVGTREMGQLVADAVAVPAARDSWVPAPAR